MGDQRGVVNGSIVPDLHELGLRHDGVGAGWIEADVPADVATVCAEEPHEVGRAVEMVEDAIAEVGLADDGRRRQVDLPPLAVG